MKSQASDPFARALHAYRATFGPPAHSRLYLIKSSSQCLGWARWGSQIASRAWTWSQKVLFAILLWATNTGMTQIFERAASHCPRPLKQIDSLSSLVAHFWPNPAGMQSKGVPPGAACTVCSARRKTALCKCNSSARSARGSSCRDGAGWSSILAFFQESADVCPLLSRHSCRGIVKLSTPTCHNFFGSIKLKWCCLLPELTSLATSISWRSYFATIAAWSHWNLLSGPDIVACFWSLSWNACDSPLCP